MAARWDDDAFEAERNEGWRWEQGAAEALRLSGREVTREAAGRSLHTTRAETAACADEADLVVHHPRHGELLVEVKSRNLAFGDDPAAYPYPTAFVDQTKAYARKTRPRCAYLLVSRRTGSILVVSIRATRHLWTVKRSGNAPRGYDADYYLIDRALLRPVDDLVDWLARP